MTDKKISELTAITGSNTAATDVFVVVDTSTGQTKKITREELNNAIEQDVLSSIDIDTINGDFSVNGNINLGDNDKAIFGAGSDLQIYHDGSDNHIVANTSNLNIGVVGGGTINLGDKFGNTLLQINDNADVKLFYGTTPAEKLATTATGINVTGTVTADGLTVDGDAVINLASTTGATLGQKGGLELFANSGTIGNGGELTWQSGSGSTETWAAISGYILENNASGSRGHMLFGTKNASTDTVLSERMRIANNGDISFYEDTGTTAKFFWDASAERLGLGTVSPSAKLQVDGNITLTNSSNATLTLQPTYGAGASIINFKASGSANQDARIASGVGSVSNITFYTGGASLAERLRIDASGNVLVGKTSTSSALTTAGVDLRPEGRSFMTRNAGPSLYLSRTTSDGNIAEFYKDGTTVGSIGVNGSSLTVGRGSSGVHFYDGGTKIIVPANPSTGADNDATVDLGYSSGRFRNLFLSSGVYLGGTGSANHLDDYEEGTWTPTVDYGTITVHYASYTKVGRMVSLKAYISNFSDRTTASSIIIRGLPFTSFTGRQSYGVAMHRYVLGGTDQIGTYNQGGNSIFYVYGCGSNLQYDLKNHSDLNNAGCLFFINHVYEASS